MREVLAVQSQASSPGRVPRPPGVPWVVRVGVRGRNDGRSHQICPCTKPLRRISEKFQRKVPPESIRIDPHSGNPRLPVLLTPEFHTLFIENPPMLSLSLSVRPARERIAPSSKDASHRIYYFGNHFQKQ